jgi:hypothetical protein
MSKPSLHDILSKHRKPMEPESSQAPAHAAEETRHVVISARDARSLFFDLPKEHKFWSKCGKEINNLTELYKSLIDMDEETFGHHVSRSKDDFAKWVGQVLGDTILARRLKASRDKVGHVEAVKTRIDELRGRGTRIPHPHTLLRPDFSFIKADRQGSSLIPPPHGFRLRGAPLQPDTTFIASHRQNEAPVYNVQYDLLETVKRDEQDQELILEDIDQLRTNYDNLFGEFNAIRNELAGLKAELQKNRLQQKEEDQKSIEEMKETVRKLRDKEREILGELKFISKTEEKIVSKNQNLMDKEAELEKKENEVLNKEKHYNKLMEKYDEMLRSIKEQMDADEKKIQTLLKKQQLQPEIKVNDQHRKGQYLDDASQKNVRTEIDKALSGKANLLEQMEIQDMLKDTQVLLSKKHYKKVKDNLEHVKKLLKSPDIDAEFKKHAYFQVFELATELDLKKK